MLGTFSPIHWVIVLAVLALLFGGRGKLSSIMGDAAKGIRAFKDGLKGEEETPPATRPASQVIPPARPDPVRPDTLDREDARR